jgi:hypothetical protein
VAAWAEEPVWGDTIVNGRRNSHPERVISFPQWPEGVLAIMRPLWGLKRRSEPHVQRPSLSQHAGTKDRCVLAPGELRLLAEEEDDGTAETCRGLVRKRSSRMIKTCNINIWGALSR